MIQTKYKIYKLVEKVYDTVPDGYYMKDIVRTELHPFDNWNDTFDTELECICQIRNYGDSQSNYTIQKEFRIYYGN